MAWLRGAMASRKGPGKLLARGCRPFAGARCDIITLHSDEFQQIERLHPRDVLARPVDGIHDHRAPTLALTALARRR
jgi:hypothetical protein